MILQALHSYYERMIEDAGSGIAPRGFGPQKISFVIVIDKDGGLVEVRDIRNVEGKKPRPVELIVPEAVIRASGIASNFLWDNTGYVLGFDEKGKPERTSETHAAFKALQHEIGDGVTDSGMQAVLKFLDEWNPKRKPAAYDWDEIVGSNVVFRLNTERAFVHEHANVKKAWMKHRAGVGNGEVGACLVSGRQAPIAALHAKIKGVKDAQTMGAALVSFNLDAFCSYGKEQNYNAPIGEEAAFAYTTALNHLLRFGSKQRIMVGDATTVFWTERDSPIEDYMGYILDPHESAVTEADKTRIDNYLKAVRAGKKPEQVQDDSMRFFILGLSPNVSRLSVRFWFANTIETFNRHMRRHFDDLSIEPEFDNQIEFPGIWRLLIETVRRYRPGQKPVDGDMNPLLSGAMFRSFVEGTPYPETILASVLGRMHADGEINYYRAALVKAVLRRNYQRQEVKMGLDEGLTDVAYRLGRLFAVLEKTQEEAIPGANATIKDRFFGSASATPRVVFPQLMRLSQHHLAKIDVRLKVSKEKLIQSILDGFEPKKGFPAHLTLEGQGMFALGYYHQRKALFTKKTADENKEQEE